ncbi:MAG: leucyl/phenylalanyl-tRNA--protein transferase [Chitinophagaceae bacterium]
MLTAHQVLHGYTQGIFPMADPDEDDAIFWYEPEMRGVIMPDEFHVPKNLRRLYNKKPFSLHINKDFRKCIEMCSMREETWISEEIIDVYCGLNKMGYGLSFEVWQDNEMVGGLYGIAMGKIFFGESMFHTVTNASKIALVFLMEWVKDKEIQVVDCQFINDHLLQFGAKEIPQEEFILLLNKALGV